jgi:hypothetical protein
LALKLCYGALEGKDTTHFRNERNALLVRLNVTNQFPVWFEQGTELAAVNAALWQAEDALRHARSWLEPAATYNDLHLDGNLLPVVYYAIRIQKLNDQRAALVHQINEKTGDSVGREKL